MERTNEQVDRHADLSGTGIFLCIRSSISPTSCVVYGTKSNDSKLSRTYPQSVNYTYAAHINDTIHLSDTICYMYHTVILKNIQDMIIYLYVCVINIYTKKKKKELRIIGKAAWTTTGKRKKEG